MERTCVQLVCNYTNVLTPERLGMLDQVVVTLDALISKSQLDGIALIHLP